MKDELCRAFCSDLTVRHVPAGIAVGTGFLGVGGDQIGFYIIGPDDFGLWRIQDDGNTVPYLEGSGADLEVLTRKQAFDDLLEEYGAAYDEDTTELAITEIGRAELPAAALKFVALLLRIQDTLFMTRERAESTWVEEATRDLVLKLAGRAIVEEKKPVSPALADYPADMVIRSDNRAPVALFFGASEPKVYEAILLKVLARQRGEACEVVALLEKDNSLTRKVRTRAENNIIVPRYREGEREAIDRIVEVATGLYPTNPSQVIDFHEREA